MEYRDTRADPQRVHGQSSSFLWPYRALQKDLVIFEILFLTLFTKHILYNSSKHYRTLLWTLWYFIKALRTHFDLHGHPSGSLNGPCEDDSMELLVKKGPPGSLHGPN